jgi:hypothetical protein
MVILEVAEVNGYSMDSHLVLEATHFVILQEPIDKSMETHAILLTLVDQYQVLLQILVVLLPPQDRVNTIMVKIYHKCKEKN